MNVNEIMTTDVVTVRDTSTIEETARLLADQGISGLPVVNESGRLIGMLTEYDLIAKQGKTAADIMSRGVISVSPETDIEEVAHVLANRRIRRIPVMQGDRVVGIVSRADLVKQIAMRWICPTCGEVVRGTEPAERCARCGASQEAFSYEAEMPGD